MSTAIAEPPSAPVTPVVPAATPPETPPVPDPKNATVATPPATPQPEPAVEDPFDLGDIARELGVEAMVGPKKKKEATPAAPVVPAAATPGTPAPATPEAPPEKKIAVRKERPVEEVVESTIRKVLDERKPATPEPKPLETPAAPAAPDPDEDYEKTLGEDEKAILETATFAETKFPEKHKGLKKQWVDYYRKIDSYIEKEQKEDPERSFDDDDKEFQDFVRDNRPAVDGAAWRRLEHLRIKEEAKQEALKEGDERWKKELDVTKERQHLLEVRPKIEKSLTQSQKELDDMLIVEPESSVALVEKILREKGYEAAVKEDPIFVPIIHTIKETTLDNVAEYLAVVNGVKRYDPANPDPKHTWLLGFIRSQEQFFNENGGDKKVIKLADGSTRTFVTSAEYGRIAKEKPQEIDRYWKFEPEDIRRFLIANGKIDAQNRVKAVQEQIAAAGFTRVKPNGAAPIAQPPNHPPVETGSPKAGTTISPGAANNVVVPQNSPFTAEEIQRMGLPIPK